MVLFVAQHVQAQEEGENVFVQEHSMQAPTHNATEAYEQDGALAGDPLALQGDVFAVPETEFSDVPDYSIGGYMESRNQFSLNQPETPTSLRQRLHLEGSGHYGALSAFASVRAEYEAAASQWEAQPHRASQVQVHEAYMTFDSENIDVIAGRKIHRWGTGDGINPMDLINPADTRDPFASGRADNRVPSLLLSITGHAAGWALESVFLPLATVSDIPAQGNPWTGSGMDSLHEARDRGEINLNHERPEDWFSQVAFGERLSTHAAGWDLSLMAFSGYTTAPVWYPESASAGAGMDYTARHPHFTAYGASFARGLGAASTVRGEVACKPDYSMNLAGWTTPFTGDLWQGVLGWDYDLDGRYYFNFQGFMDRYGGMDSSGNRQIRTWHGMTYEVSAKWLRDDLKTGIRGRIYTSEDGMLNELFVEYSLGDNWKFLSGIMLWDGPNDGALGRFSASDQVYCTIRYSF